MCHTACFLLRHICLLQGKRFLKKNFFFVVLLHLFELFKKKEIFIPFLQILLILVVIAVIPLILLFIC